ncbi:hypothetical protein [Sulfitobacter sp. R18_1]|uniref:hypothetical protein n=1 Tax=Sulfitobacter sp. R18_1 TaxID=2821104 RepID=UPI001ADAFB07|nr:hypothetical protein [Sulfitobacter sp. R18_1]MBO9432317.1 hypothetical protein [Sulfitobacter sp. R18_1]
MKLSLGAIGIGLSILVMLQFMVFNKQTGGELTQASSFGITFAVLVFGAGALTFKLPRLGGGVFVVAAFLAFSISNDFPDMAFWGSASLVLGTLSGFFGWKDYDLADNAESG